MQQQIPGKFHPDRSTFVRMAAEMPVYDPERRTAMTRGLGGGGGMAVNDARLVKLCGRLATHIYDAQKYARA